MELRRSCLPGDAAWSFARPIGAAFKNSMTESHGPIEPPDCCILGNSLHGGHGLHRFGGTNSEDTLMPIGPNHICTLLDEPQNGHGFHVRLFVPYQCITSFGSFEVNTFQCIHCIPRHRLAFPTFSKPERGLPRHRNPSLSTRWTGAC